MKNRNKKLKRIDAGEYIYGNRFRIENFGYDRIYGRVRWNVFDENETKSIFQTDTLKEAVQNVQLMVDKNETI